MSAGLAGAQAQGKTGGTRLTLFGRGMYPGDDSTYEMLRGSGFGTIVLSSFYIRSNGDVYSGDDGQHPIIHDGRYVGDRGWLTRIASLRKGEAAGNGASAGKGTAANGASAGKGTAANAKVGSVSRVEILLEGRWFNQNPNTYDFIQDWVMDPGKSYPGVTTGTGKNSTLYAIARVFKKDLGVDAVCIDDESVYNDSSIVGFGRLLGGLGMHMTLCPYTKAEYWKAIINGSKPGLIDAIYLQCYDGGARNAPGQWVDKLPAGLPIDPIFSCRGAFGTCGSSHGSQTPEEIGARLAAFKKDYPAMSGAALWQVADIKDYIRMNCAVKDPSSGNAGSVADYLSLLKNSLEIGDHGVSIKK
ncbi:MAG: hypothetical protein JST42_03080 [Bacteroidetes bacterium]|nr:hypothetical protein [Bacteroidota bacterium]